MKSIEAQGKTVDQAIEIGLYKLGVTRDQVKIAILEEAGLFSKARVRLSLDTSSEKETELKNLVEEVVKLMGLDLDVYVEEREEDFLVDITGKDASLFIGKHGENLEGFAYLISQITQKENIADNHKRIVVDSDGYKSKREETLKILAQRTAGRVVSTGKSVRLEPMNPAERRIIHTTLADHAKVTTISNGKEPYRFVTVMLKNGVDKRKSKHDERKAQKQEENTFTNIEISTEERADND